MHTALAIVLLLLCTRLLIRVQVLLYAHYAPFKSYWCVFGANSPRTLRSVENDITFRWIEGWLHHIRLAIKPRYLGKSHASQIKSYIWTLSESHGRSYSIRQVKSPEAPPGGEITMTSYPACNKISLSRKPCIVDKELLWNTIRKLWSFSRIRHVKSPEAPSDGGLTMTSYTACNKMASRRSNS